MRFRNCYYYASSQSNSLNFLFKIILISLFAYLLSSCTGDQPATPVATNDVVEPLVTEPVEATSLATEEVSNGQGIFIPAESVRYQTEDRKLFVVVTSVNNAESMPNLPEAPVGEKFLVLSTTLANFTGEEIQVEASSLTLIDQQLNRYSPVQPDDFLRTPLFEVVLNGSTTVLGSVRFAIPTDAIPYLLEWCPYNDCEVETLQTFLP